MFFQKKKKKIPPLHTISFILTHLFQSGLGLKRSRGVADLGICRSLLFCCGVLLCSFTRLMPSLARLLFLWGNGQRTKMGGGGNRIQNVILFTFILALVNKVLLSHPFSPNTQIHTSYIALSLFISLSPKHFLWNSIDNLCLSCEMQGRSHPYFSLFLVYTLIYIYACICICVLRGNQTKEYMPSFMISNKNPRYHTTKLSSHPKIMLCLLLCLQEVHVVME